MEGVGYFGVRLFCMCLGSGFGVFFKSGGRVILMRLNYGVVFRESYRFEYKFFSFGFVRREIGYLNSIFVLDRVRIFF